MSMRPDGSVAVRPSGTVTFLFTDVEGSTVRWERDPEVMSSALTEHDSILRSTIEGYGGFVFAAGGDGFAAAFNDASSALHAAADGQHQLSLPVRMGLHTGTAEERDGNYFGRTLNRAARIMSAGHGGQILLSDVTAALVREDADLTDLGEHRLAGVEALTRLWQVGYDAFPPLRTATHATGNLPLPLDRFVGRGYEIGELSDRLKTQRLLTVVGVGGMGKTRLAVEALHRSELDAADGVWFVDLSVADSDQVVVDEVASLFGIQASPGRSVEDRLVEHIEDKTLVMIFDNCEHVLSAAGGLIDRLLHASPRLRIVATSREPLMLRGEHVMALGPLSVDPSADDGAEVESVDLFLDRVIAEGASVNIDRLDRAVVLDICRRLDGMPLAIELAAARARTLGAAAVLARLGESLRLLSGGWRTSVGRQQTLAATLDWSYRLLDENEQVVFDRLGVFVGWFTLDDAIAVARDSRLDDDDVIDAVSGLVDKSMCVADLGTMPAGYRYLETMRSYGRDHLSQGGSLVACRDRHATHMAAAARRVRKALVGPGELEASREAERVIADLRSALGWAVGRQLGAVIDDVADLALVISIRGDFEMRSWCYELREDLPDNGRIQQVAVSHAVSSVGDVIEMRRLCERLIEIDDGAFAGVALQNLGLAAFNEGHFEQAIEYLRRAYEFGEAAPNDLDHRVMNSVVFGSILSSTGRDARKFVKQALDRANAAGWPTGVAWANCAAGLAELDMGNSDAGLVALERAIDVAVGVGSRDVETMATTFKVYYLSTLLPPGELAVALIELLRRLSEIGDTHATLLALSQVMVLFDKVGRHDTGAVVCGWLDGRSSRNVQSVGEHDAAISSIRRSTGDDWDRLIEQGQSMIRRQIIDFACDELATIR